MENFALTKMIGDITGDGDIAAEIYEQSLSELLTVFARAATFVPMGWEVWTRAR
jgi:hypothetical protein